MPRTVRDEVTGDFLGRGYDQWMRIGPTGLNVYDSPSRGGGLLQATPTDLEIVHPSITRQSAGTDGQSSQVSLIRNRAGRPTVAHMPQFLAEAYVPRDSADMLAFRSGDRALAMEQVSEETAPARFLGAIYVPQDETCFYLYRAQSAGAVREAITRAGLQPERITQAVSTGWTAAPEPGTRRLTVPQEM
jgi:hypothetical protein